MTTRTFDVAPGITRIESILGPRPFAQYLLRDERALLVDTGVKETPAEVILPALAGVEPDYVVITHADVDHFGGSAAIRDAAPHAVFLAHEADAPWIEDPALIMRERYGWYDRFGVGYDADTFSWLENAMGPPVPVDIRLRGGEKLRLGPALSVEVIALPGHSPGHIGLWEPSSRSAIVIDAVMANGLLDTGGTVVAPPPVVDARGYEQSVALLARLEPERLLTAHYDVIEGAAVARFLEDSLAFIERARAVVVAAIDSGRPVVLRELLARADEILGPFTSMPNELAATLRSLLQERGVEPVP